ncbi:MAG: Hpt domain-containing protein [Pirellulales bacterium]|nr:Hpt domain-containing protein [Pirellulales bacterium]
MSEFDAAAHDEFYKSLLGDFLGESEQLLVALNENLLQLDQWTRLPVEQRLQQSVDNLLRDLFRSSHSLKGLSNMLGLDEIEHLVYHIEKVFDAARKGKLDFDGKIVELLFEAIDRLSNLIDGLKDPDAPAVQYEELLDRMGQLLREAGTDTGDLSRPWHAEQVLRRIETQIAHALSGVEESPAERETSSETPRRNEPVFGATASVAVSRSDAPAPPARDVADDKPKVVMPKVVISGVTDAFDGLVDDADMSSRFIPIFIDEADLALDQLTNTLLESENGGSLSELRSLMVIAHRIKGAAASVGLTRSAKLAHFMEDLLQELVESEHTLSPDVADAMLKCIDGLRGHVAGLKQGVIPSDRFPELAAALDEARRKAAGDVSTPVVPAGEASAPRPEPSPRPPHDGPAMDVAEPPGIHMADETNLGDAAAAQPVDGHAEESMLVPISGALRRDVMAVAPIGIPLYVGVATFQSNLALVGLKAELLYEKLSNVGNVCYFDPPIERLDSIERLNCIRFGLATERPERQIHDALKTAGVVGSVVEALSAAVTGDASRIETARKDAAASGGVHHEANLAEDSVAAALSPERGAAVMVPPTAPSKSCSKDRGSRSVESTSKPTETLRVDVDRLDQLMNLAGRLVVSKARFAQISDLQRTILGNKRSSLALKNVLESLDRIAELENSGDHQGSFDADIGSISAQARRIHGQLDAIRREMESFHKMHNSINELEEAVQQLDRVADDIQKNVMETRMVPIGPLFTRFHRVVRDITRASNDKTVRLEIHGENTELDKRMIDELSDPLIHLVRNSADHGIEPSEDRVRSGKPAEGTITLDAFHRGNSVLIQISDDGRGLEPNRILDKAIEKGFINSRDAERMTPQQILNLIWLPGFSTAGQVTEVSGRGVGMDIVRSRVESLNGTVELDSTPGRGVTVTIKLPLTLAILPSLMVELGGDVFAMPMESVVEIVKVGSEDIATVHGKMTAQVRGRVVSLLHLDEVFQWRGTMASSDRSCPGQCTLVIVGDGEQEIGLVIDRVLGEEDVVIKSMAENYKNVPGISGASVLGSGRVSLILDLAAVIAMAAQPNQVPVLNA